jgi:hypothetical protein
MTVTPSAVCALLVIDRIKRTKRKEPTSPLFRPAAPGPPRVRGHAGFGPQGARVRGGDGAAGHGHVPLVSDQALEGRGSPLPLWPGPGRQGAGAAPDRDALRAAQGRVLHRLVHHPYGTLGCNSQREMAGSNLIGAHRPRGPTNNNNQASPSTHQPNRSSSSPRCARPSPAARASCSGSFWPRRFSSCPSSACEWECRRQEVCGGRFLGEPSDGILFLLYRKRRWHRWRRSCAQTESY